MGVFFVGKKVKVSMHVMHVNVNFPFRLGPKGGLLIIYECV